MHGFPALLPESSSPHFPHKALCREIRHLKERSWILLRRQEFRPSFHFLPSPGTRFFPPLPSSKSLQFRLALQFCLVWHSLHGVRPLFSPCFFSWTQRSRHHPPRAHPTGYPGDWIGRTPSVFSPRPWSPFSFRPGTYPHHQRHSPHD